MSVVEGVRRDLASITAPAPALAESALAMAALALAAEIDNPGNSATSKSMCAKELRDILTALRALAPAKHEQDGVDDLSQRRSARLAGSKR